MTKDQCSFHKNLAGAEYLVVLRDVSIVFVTSLAHSAGWHSGSFSIRHLLAEEVNQIGWCCRL